MAAARGEIGMVWAQTPGGVIAADEHLPWDVPEDFQHFRDTVAGRVVIVGRPTWESMPPPWRRNRGAASIVVTRDPEWVAADDDDALRAGSFPEAVTLARDSAGPDADVWVMGGGQIYGLGMAVADVLVVSEIDVAEPVAASVLTLAPPIEAAAWHEEISADSAWRTSRTGTAWRIRRYRRSGPRPGARAGAR